MKKNEKAAMVILTASIFLGLMATGVFAAGDTVGTNAKTMGEGAQSFKSVGAAFSVENIKGFGYAGILDRESVDRKIDLINKIYDADKADGTVSVDTVNTLKDFWNTFCKGNPYDRWESGGFPKQKLSNAILGKLNDIAFGSGNTEAKTAAKDILLSIELGKPTGTGTQGVSAIKGNYQYYSMLLDRDAVNRKIALVNKIYDADKADNGTVSVDTVNTIKDFWNTFCQGNPYDRWEAGGFPKQKLSNALRDKLTEIAFTSGDADAKAAAKEFLLNIELGRPTGTGKAGSFTAAGVNAIKGNTGNFLAGALLDRESVDRKIALVNKIYDADKADGTVSVDTVNTIKDFWNTFCQGSPYDRWESGGFPKQKLSNALRDKLNEIAFTSGDPDAKKLAKDFLLEIELGRVKSK